MDSVGSDVFDKVRDAVNGEDFILLLRSPDDEGGNCGVHLLTNASADNAKQVIKKLATLIDTLGEIKQ